MPQKRDALVNRPPHVPRVSKPLVRHDVFPLPDACPLALAVRLSLKLSQEEFAETFCIDIQELRQWEAAQANPCSAGDALLHMIDTTPNEVASLVKLMRLRRSGE